MGQYNPQHGLEVTFWRTSSPKTMSK